MDSPGPYAAGTISIRAAGTTVQVWYPAPKPAVRHARRYVYDIRNWLPAALARGVKPGEFTYRTDSFVGVPVAGGHFPLVLFVHGLNSYRDQSSFLTAWLATWGYVVAAPDLPQHDLTSYFAYGITDAQVPGAEPDQTVLAATELALYDLSARPGGPLSGSVDVRRVAVIGHSQGGIDAMAFASRAEVTTYIPLAAGFLGAHPPLPPVPSLYMAAALDRDIPAAYVRAVYADAAEPKRLVVLPAAGHLAFTDMCSIGPRGGGLALIAREMGGVALPAGAPFVGAALDGCGAAYRAPWQSQAAIRLAVLAQLRRSLPPI